VYTLGREGNFVDSRLIEAESDEEAMIVAAKFVEKNDLEVWIEKRRVGTIQTKKE
jgi:hypothetical protein